MRAWFREKVWYRIRPRLRIYRVSKRKVVTKEEVDLLFPDVSRCVHCGGWHLHSCPRVKAIKFLGETPSEIEFWAWGAWPADQVIFPWQKAAMITPPKEEQ